MYVKLLYVKFVCVCEVIVCERWYVTKLCVCVKLLHVRDAT